MTRLVHLSLVLATTSLLFSPIGASAPKEMRGGPGGKWQLCERSRGQSGGQDGGDFFAA